MMLFTLVTRKNVADVLLNTMVVPDSGMNSEYFKIKVTFKVAILNSIIHQHLNLTYCYVVYIAVMLSLMAGVE